MRTFILFCLIFFTSFAVEFEYTEVVTLYGGWTYNQIQSDNNGDAGFLQICSVVMQDAYPNDDNDITCTAVAENTMDADYIDVTVGSDVDGMILNVKMAMENNGLDALVYGDYQLYETDEELTVDYVNDFATWTASGNMDDFADYCAVRLKDYGAACSEPVENEDGNVQITYTIPASNVATVESMVDSSEFKVAGYGSLEAVADPTTCEKIDQADLVIWVNTDGTLYSSNGDEKATGTCFQELPQMQAQDRTYVDELAGYNLLTTIAVFGQDDAVSASIASTIEGFGYQTVYDAGSLNAVQGARSGAGCQCALEQPIEVVEVEVDDYDMSIAGLAVGIAGVVLLFGACVLCVRMRDAIFTDEVAVSQKMQQQQDILEKIRQTEEASTMGEKNLPVYESAPYQPFQKAWDKESCKVTGKLDEEEQKTPAMEEAEV